MAGNHRRGFSNRISTYLRQAGSYTLLSAAQEEQLSRQIAEGNTQARKAMMPRIHPGYGAFMHEMTFFCTNDRPEVLKWSMEYAILIIELKPI